METANDEMPQAIKMKSTQSLTLMQANWEPRGARDSRGRLAQVDFDPGWLSKRVAKTEFA
jgi:hypothetical protein